MQFQPFRVLGPDGTLDRLNLHDGQITAMETRARFPMMFAGTKGGKTCFGPHWLHKEILDLGELYPEIPNDYFAATATYDLFKLKMRPELLEVFEHILQIGRYWAGEQIIELCDMEGKFWAKQQHDKMWGRIILRSADSKVGLESGDAKAAWADELGLWIRQSWEALCRRVAIAQGRILGTTTLYKWGWMKDEIYDRGCAGDPDYKIIQFDSLVNPAFPRAEYERARHTMPPWKFALFYQGQYEKPAGLIYDSFDETTCKIGRSSIPEKWPRFVGHDFGGANPAAMFYAQDPATGYFYAYHEYLPGPGRSIAQHVVEFKRITEGTTVIKRAGGSHQEDEIRQGYTAHGWPIQEPKVVSVEAGIDRVYALHKLNKLFVFDDLQNYLDEKLSYSRKLDDNYQPTEEIEDKARFHLMDAERYILSDFTPETVVSGKPIVIRPKWRF